MPAYNYQERFWPFVSEGSKTHTIRGKRKRGRQAVGGFVHNYRGMRTKNCKRLMPPTLCTHMQDIVISKAGRVWLDDAELDENEKNLFAWRDGFRPNGSTATKPGQAFSLMLAFWKGKRPFYGDVIHWTYPAPRGLKWAKSKS